MDFTWRNIQLVEQFDGVETVVQKAISEGVFPGACYAFGNLAQLNVGRAGRLSYCPDCPETQIDTLWDMASVTKVIATTTLAMLEFERGKLDLAQPVSEILPEFKANGKEKITVLNLLLHDSGLAPDRNFHLQRKSGPQVIEGVLEDKLEYPTGAKTVYSDLGIITLGKVLEKLGGAPFYQLVHKQVFAPLGMNDSIWNPKPKDRMRAAWTEHIEDWRTELRKTRGLETDEVRELETLPDKSRFIRGEVHDPTAMAIGGVAGHAGLFSTIEDVVTFMQMLLAKGGDLMKPDTVAKFTKRQNDRSSRGLGWDTNAGHQQSAGKSFSETSFGHTGYTGTCVWLDPEKQVFAILLTNRVHPTAANTKIIQFRPLFHETVMHALAS